MIVVRPSLLVAALLVCGSCQRGDSDSADTSRGADTATVRAGSTTGTVSGATCGVDARATLTGDGIGELRVGESIDQVARGCRIVRDTIVRGAEGMRERQLLVDLGRDSVMVVVDSNRVWRLHVRSPDFRTTDSIGVSSPASSLRRPGARLLTGEGAYFVTLPSHCGLSFRLSGVEFGRLRTVEQIPNSATVSEVLVVGCRTGSS